MEQTQGISHTCNDIETHIQLSTFPLMRFHKGRDCMIFSFFIKKALHLSVYVYTQMQWHTRVGQRAGWVLLFHPIDSRDQIQIIRLGRQAPSLTELFHQHNNFTGAFPIYVAKVSWDVTGAQSITVFKIEYEFSVLDKIFYSVFDHVFPLTQIF